MKPNPMIRKNKKNVAYTLSCAVLVASLLAQVSPSYGRPGMIGKGVESPSVGAPAQKVRDIGVGDVSYESPTGSLNYGYQFVVPPGRLGLQPSLALAYSSQGSLRGGIAAGWSLDVPIIQRDYSGGSMGKGPGTTNHEDIPFMSSMSGGHQLVPVSDEQTDPEWQAYRARQDDQYIRYERKRIGGQWRARTLDGKTWYFGMGHDGESDTLETYVPHMRDASGTAFPVDDRQPLTRVVDPFGNTIHYYWIIEGLENSGVPSRDTAAGAFLKTIRYSENYDAGLPSHARVEFEYVPGTFCSEFPESGELPVGASLDFRGGSAWFSGRNTLDRVETFVRQTPSAPEEKVRRVKLGIASLCPSNGGATRQLNTVTVTTPEGPSVAAPQLSPPITFEYGDSARSFDAAPKTFILPGPVSGASSVSSALSWGSIRGYDEEGEPTLEQTLLDFDGDGRLDMLRMSPQGECMFDFYRNTGSKFQRTRTLDFPNEGLEWELNSATPKPGEGCSLSARRTKWNNKESNIVPGQVQYGTYLSHRFIDMNKDGLPDLVTAIRLDGEFVELTKPGNPNPYVPGVSEVLKEIPPNSNGSCLEVSSDDVENTIVENCFTGNSGDTQCCESFDMKLLDPIIDDGKAVGCADLMEEDPYGWTEGAGPVSLEVQGQYPWMVYYNTGGALDLKNGERIWSPIPLDPAGAESSIGGANGAGYSSKSHALMDINGDGVVDALAPGGFVPSASVEDGDGGSILPRFWQVFAGSVDSSTGEFLGFEHRPYFWIVPEHAVMSESTSGTSQYFPSLTNPVDVVHSVTLSTLADMNGDGLPDLIRRKHGANNPGLETALNTGSGFCKSVSISNSSLTINETAYDEAELQCLSIAGPPLATQTPGCTNLTAITGSGESLLRLTDIDGDGLLDRYNAKPEVFDGPTPLPVVSCSDGTCAAVQISGAGGGFQEASSHIAGLGTHIPRNVEVESLWWGVFSDFMDLDGDGLDDVIHVAADATLLSDDTSAGKPLRLLNKIDNGQGLVTSVEYLPYNETSTSNMPAHVWAVSKIITESLLDPEFDPAPPSQVLIEHGDAVYNLDYRGNYGFRGFESTSISSPHGVAGTPDFTVTEKRYGYGQDYSGRLSRVVLYADGFAKQQPHSIETKTWKEMHLFDGATKSYKVQYEEDRLCEGLVEASTCFSKPYDEKRARAYLAKKKVYGGASDSALAYQQYQLITYIHGQAYMLEQDFSNLWTDDDKYWMQPYLSQALLASATNGWDLIRKTIRSYDATKTYVKQSAVLADTTGPGLPELLISTTIRSLDTGNVETYQDPRDYGSALFSANTYTGFEIAPTSSTNELGQTATTEIDLGTGQTVRSQGPNALTDCGSSERGGGRTTFDGLGRPTAVYEIGCDGSSYSDSRLLSTIDYEDFNGGVPAHATATSFLDDSGNPQATVSTMFVDGAGRTVRTVVEDGTLGGIVSSNAFDAHGRLVRTSGPNPDTAAGAPAAVDNKYEYDTLGRVVAIRQAESFDGGQATGTNTSYGFTADRTLQTKTITEHLPSAAAGYPVSETKTYTDALGRVVRVDESLSSGVASTYYEFDGNDNVKKITDSDGVITVMEHDMASRRTKIVRGEREWTYGYDKNGNIEFETGPSDTYESASNPSSGVYSTSTVYDALDRPTSRILATKGLSASQLEVFDATEVTFGYDTCTNGIGRACSITTGLNLTTNYVYDYAGRIIEEHQDIELPESVVDFGDSDTDSDFVESRTTYMEYNLAGAATDVWIADAPTKAASTHLSYSFDPLGAPKSVTYHAATGDVLTSVIRNKAQRIVQQTTGCLTRDWGFDHKGRVTDTLVTGASCTAQNGSILYEAMIYGGSSEVDEHTVERAGLSSHTFTYSYDKQHQLVGATNGVTGAGGYNVGFAYSPAGRLVNVGGLDGLPIVGRGNMSYDDVNATPGILDGYGDGTLIGGDYHAPLSLLGDKDVEYDYDFAGNATRRQEWSDQTSVGLWDFSYDGSNQQREVLLDGGAGGRELYYYDHAGSRYMAVTYSAGTDVVPERIRVWVGGAEVWYAPKVKNNASQSFMEVQTEYANFGLGGLPVGRVKTEGIVKTTEASFHNGLSHLMGAVDWDSGVVNAAFVYGPYGEVLESIGTETDDHLRRFNGKEADQLSKLSYYGYRYYDELSLSWTQADPLYLFLPDIAASTPREMTLYAFSLNNPVRYMDPDGRQAEDAGPEQGKPQDAGQPEPCPGGLGSNDEGCGTMNPEETPENAEILGEVLVEQAEGLVDAIVSVLSNPRPDQQVVAGVKGSIATVQHVAAVVTSGSDRDKKKLAMSIGVGMLVGVVSGKFGLGKGKGDGPKGGPKAISMDEAVSLAAEHVKGKGVMEITGRGDPTRGNYQFRHVQDGTTFLGRFDINPNNSTTKTTKQGPHLNLETHAPGGSTNIHIPIDPKTVRPGDYPQ